jgi:hypothetical protein
MKKQTYQKPATETVAMPVAQPLLAGSGLYSVRDYTDADTQNVGDSKED